MKVQFCKSIDVEAEVTIDIDDIRQALHDLLADADRVVKFKGNTERAKQFTIQQFVGGVHQCLSAVTNEMIAALSPNQREAIANAILAQAIRFKIADCPVPEVRA